MTSDVSINAVIMFDGYDGAKLKVILENSRGGNTKNTKVEMRDTITLIFLLNYMKPDSYRVGLDVPTNLLMKSNFRIIANFNWQPNFNTMEDS